MGWIETSYMGRRGVARGAQGRTHEITEEVQGEYRYVYGPYAEPVLRIKPGDIVCAHTKDAFGGAIKTEADLPSKVLNMPFVNPQNGPVAVEGAEKGDALAVRILSIVPRGPQPAGTTALIPEFGGLVATPTTAMLNAPIAEKVKKMEVTTAGVKFSDRITLPYEPFVGTLGVSPEIEAVSSLQPDYWAATWTCPRGARRHRLFPGPAQGRLSLHGRLPRSAGDGELCGVAVEIPAVLTVQVDLIKGWGIPGVRLETEDFIMSVGSARPMEDAARIAYRDLIRWLVSDYGFDEFEADSLVYAGRSRPRRQHGGPEIHARGLHAQNLHPLKRGTTVDLGLKGLNALVTGGSKGIGRRCADIFADEGANVSGVRPQCGRGYRCRRRHPGEGVEGFGQAVDVADKAALEAWVAASADALGGLDILVANVSALALLRTTRRPGGAASRWTCSTPCAPSPPPCPTSSCRRRRPSSSSPAYT